ncbi:MAG: NUDIX domain-containing protein [Candidatus Woykebacteria bacterium]
MDKDKQFYVGQKAFIERKGEVLVLIDPDLGVDLPGGKIQIGEYDFDEALKREVFEEAGIVIDIGQPFTRWYFKFKDGHRNEGKEVYLVGFKCIYLSGEVKISDEHSEFEWVNKISYRELDDGSGHFKALEKYFLGT